MRQGAAYPVLHLDVLKQSIRRDYHREEAAKDPMLAFAERNNALRKAVWHAMHPGASGTEWAEQRDAYLATEEPGWWTHDPDLTANWKPQSVADVNPASRYLDRKLCNLYTDDATPLASARYEGTGFVSKLTISPGARKVRVPLHEEPASADSKSVSVRAVAGDDIVVGLQDKSLVWRTGESDAFPVSEVAWSEIDNLLRLGDKHFELHPATSTETVLCRIRDLAREAGVPCTIPNQIPLGLHHLAAICKEVVNSAHTKHCFLAEALQRRYASGPCGNAFRVAEDEVHFLPTVLNAWEEAGSPAADSPPTGLAIQRRRFDSWQLNSGKGRYDYSPTKDEQWKHPIEENPVVYGFQDVQEPMSTL
ncbi:hypothetical protein DIPPA_33428 [Diplonema papillatum]|nr:hypothetical protein DIPPA_33428 [Diplonema papillatum]